MPSTDKSSMVSRRALLEAAILMVGGTMVAPAAMAATANPFFAVSERATLDVLCDTMIPRTDTPGAIDAGVPAFLDGLMSNWASPAHQAAMRNTIALLGRAAQADNGKSITSLSPTERSTWLAKRDAALLASRDPGYAQFKRLVMTGYYYSEAGATKELRYELVPGVWEPAVKITPETRTWAA